MKQNTEKTQGQGMSRAAKKRAKKNQKKPEAKRPIEDAKQEPELKKMKVDKDIDEPEKVVKMNADDGSVESEVDPEFEVEEEGDAPVLETASYIPTLQGATLTEILMATESKNEENAKLIKELSSSQRAACLFRAIIYPISLDEFYNEYWEKKPLLAKCDDSTKERYNNLLSLASIQELSKKTDLFFARDLNVTKYQKDKDGVKRRATLDKTPTESEEETGAKVDSKELWKNYNKGCTVRLLCPHKHFDPIHALLSTLELELQCMVGANAYLTPPKASQGFAPHYDDIEAFCLQLEGKKRWKVYEPLLELPRASSEDYTVDDLKDLEPVMDITLEKGDLLYMPRGWIHQACTLKDDNEHSLHLTVSAMQQWAWVDLLDVVIPEALANSSDSEAAVSLREGLPRGFMEYMGVMYDEANDDNLPESLKKVNEEDGDEEIRFRRMLREKFQADAKKRIMKVAKMACEMVDAACDELSKRFISERQPLALTNEEAAQTSKGKEDYTIVPNTLCRLVRPGVARLVIEEEKAVVYHCADNSREYQGNPLSPLEFEMDDGPAIEQLLTTVEPHWIFVNDLYHDTIEDKVSIAQSLFDEGILAVKETESDE